MQDGSMATRRALTAVVALVALTALASLFGPASPARAAEVREGTVAGFGAGGGTAPEGSVALASAPGGGWWSTTASGLVHAAEGAPTLGDLRDSALRRPIVGMAASPVGTGYWLVAGDGGVFTFGAARFHGSAGRMALRSPIVGMAASPVGGGYWLVAGDGGVFTFGDAGFFGSAASLPLRSPIVAMAATPSGRGYWLVAGDGGVFSFGDARFAGTGPVGTVGIAASPAGGYRLAGADGTVAARGTDHRGDLAGGVPDASVVAITGAGGGYRLLVGPVQDFLELWQPGGLRANAQAWALGVADRVGARATVWHRGTLDLVGVHRGFVAVQEVASSWRVPMATLAVEPAASSPLLGRTLTSVLARGEVALGVASAALRGAAVGDTVEVLGWDGRTHRRRVGALADDSRTGSAELVLSIAEAGTLGFRRPFEVRIWGRDRATLEGSLGVERPPVPMGLDRSWASTGRDPVASAVRLKQVLGEVQYRPSGGTSVTLHPAWRSAIVTERVPVLGRVTCHRAMLPALSGALGEVARAGLGGSLGTYGGCFNARRVAGGDSGGNLSRHSFGIAVDLNIARNSFGGRVDMHPRVVAIFRRWGFAWGGTWVRADGMHFEWVP